MKKEYLSQVVSFASIALGFAVIIAVIIIWPIESMIEYTTVKAGIIWGPFIFVAFYISFVIIATTISEITDRFLRKTLQLKK